MLDIDPAIIAEIHRLYGDFIMRANLAPNLLIVEPNSPLATATSVLGMRVIVNDGARVDYQVAYTL